MVYDNFARRNYGLFIADEGVGYNKIQVVVDEILNSHGLHLMPSIRRTTGVRRRSTMGGGCHCAAQRNFEAVLDLMASEVLDVAPSLIFHRHSINGAVDAYDILTPGESSLGILLEYPIGVR